MTRRRVVLFTLPVLLIGSLFLFGGDRRPPRNLSQKTVGSIVLDSSVRVTVLHAAEDLRLDGVKEDFVPAYTLRVARNGTIIIPQQKDWKYLFYSPEGKRIASFGARGDGPGEFGGESIGILSGWLGDTLWIYDGSKKRITYVSTLGEYSGDERLRLAFAAPLDLGRFPLLFANLVPYAVREDGFIVTASAWNASKGGPWDYRNRPRPLLWISPSGMIRRLTGDFPPFAEGDTASTMGQYGPTSVSLPLRNYPLFSMSDRGDHVGYLTTHVDDDAGGHFRLSVLTHAGDTLIARDYRFAGERIPARVADSILEFRASRTGGAAGDVIRSEGRKRMSPFYPPISALVFGRDSTIWLGMRPTAAGKPWMVLGSNGEPIGTVVLPTGARVGAADRAHIWTIQLNDDDIPSVVRYAVTGWQ